MRKKIEGILYVLLSLLMLLSFVACCDATAEFRIKEEFSQYERDQNIALIMDDRVVYFYDYKLDLSALEIFQEEEKFLRGGIVIHQSEIYFAAIGKREDSFSVFIYKCDLHGGNLKLLYEEGGYKKYVNACAYESYIYFNGPSSAKTQLKRYDVTTGETETVFTDREYYDPSAYVVEMKSKNNNGFSYEARDYELYIRLKEEDIYISTEMLEEYDFGRSLSKMGYLLPRAFYLDGHLLLGYAMDDGCLGYIFCILEYNLENGELTYKTILSAYDTVWVELTYIN